MVVRNEVIYIDDREDSRKMLISYLQQAFGDEAKVSAVGPKPTIQETVKSLSENWKIGSIIADERLNESGEADFTGQELCVALREVYPKLPIYILTAYPDSVSNKQYTIESILSKDQLKNKDGDDFRQFSIYARRYLGTFDDIMSERGEEYTNLLRKKIAGTIDEQGKERLLKIETELVKPVAYEEVVDSKLTEKLDKQEKLIEEIRKMLEN